MLFSRVAVLVATAVTAGLCNSTVLANGGGGVILRGESGSSGTKITLDVSPAGKDRRRQLGDGGAEGFSNAERGLKKGDAFATGTNRDADLRGGNDRRPQMGRVSDTEGPGGDANPRRGNDRRPQTGGVSDTEGLGGDADRRGGNDHHPQMGGRQMGRVSDTKDPGGDANPHGGNDHHPQTGGVQAGGDLKERDSMGGDLLLGGDLKTKGLGILTNTEQLLPMEMGNGNDGDVRVHHDHDSLAIHGGLKIGATRTTIAVEYPWEINFLDLVVDFSTSSTNELTLSYDIGKNHSYEVFLYQRDCESTINDIDIDLNTMLTPKNATFESLVLAYNFNKTAIGYSNVWNATSSKIEICQVVNLFLPAAGSLPKMVVTEDVRQVDINFDLSVDYSTNSSLGVGSTFSESGLTNVTSYVQAFKCSGDNFNDDSQALLPNTELHVCIKSISSEVEVDRLVSMDVSQGETVMPVISNGNILVPTFTSLEYVSSENGALVSSRVPSNMFSFAVGQSITISGVIVMKFVGSSRKLRVDIAAKVDDNEEASYKLKIDLQDEVVLEDDALIGNSDIIAASQGFTMLVMIFAFATSMCYI